MNYLPKQPGVSSLLAIALAGVTALAQGAGPAALREPVQSRINLESSRLVALYKELHAHPELSYQEEKTAAQIADQLKEAGFEVTAKVGGHGVVGVLRNGAGPTILIRTDLDALPVKEETGLSYASQARTKDDKGNEVNVMHACGHDMHMTVFSGTARVLASLKDQWKGTLVMIGQPAEERVGGAKAMLAAGLFTRFPKPDYCLALHVNAQLPAGSVGYTEGYMLANVDGLNVTIRGVGGHGAWPHTTKDPIVLAAQTILALQTIVSRETQPGEPAVITVGSIHGGTKHNIIPDEVTLQLTLRSYSDEVRAHSIAAVKRITKGLAQAAGIPDNRLPIVAVENESSSATYNDPALTQRVVKSFQSWLGEQNTIREKPVMGAEDFGLFGRTEDKIPICMFWLGSVEPQRVQESKRSGQPLPSLHSSTYHPVPETTIKTGVTAMTAAVLELAGNK
ncbi:MAG: amidohydrolase [Pedosphaera sp.]|nr:amidohydrolase [Pedosphaera sp.]